MDGDCVCRDTGEIQLTQYGISGIPVFQVSRFAAKALYNKQEVTAVLNFMPQMSEEEFTVFLAERARLRPQKTAEEFLTGLFHKKMIALWVKCSRISKEKPVGTYSEEELRTLVRLIQQFEVNVEGTNSFEQAQVCCGGVSTEEVKEDTPEVKLCTGRLFCRRDTGCGWDLRRI